MRKIQKITRVLSAAIIFALALCFFSISASAANGPDDTGNVIETEGVDTETYYNQTETQDTNGGGTAETVPDSPTEPEQTPTEPDADSGDGGNGYDDVIDGVDAASAYTEPEHLDELPTADPNEVIEATAVVLPDVEVSDASLFSGLVMWLCVAVGIAVVIGVMVSKRTHRRGQ